MAVTATMCRLLPTATVWRLPSNSRLFVAESNTFSVTSRRLPQREPDCYSVGVTLRSTGPASTRGLLLSEFRSDVQAIVSYRPSISEPRYISYYLPEQR